MRLDRRLLADARGHPRRRRDEVADTADVDHDPGGVRAATVPRSREITRLSRRACGNGTGDAGRLVTRHPQQRRRERVADRDGERVGGVIGLRHLVEREDRLHHPLHLPLVGAAVAADRLLDPARRVLDALDAGGRRGDEHRAARLPDGERDAGVGADVRLLQGDGIRGVQADQLRHPLEDREQPPVHALPRRCSPPPVADGPEAPVAFVDDSVPASSRPWIDAENLHEERLGTPADVPARRRASDQAESEPDASERRPRGRYAVAASSTCSGMSKFA